MAIGDCRSSTKLSFHMNRPATTIVLATALLFSAVAPAQEQDSTRNITTLSGSLGVTNNGISIIPTFALNSPAAIVLLSWKTNKFSFDPDIRLTPDARKGGMVFWFRYQAVAAKKIILRIGAHPAFNFQTRAITEGGKTSTITQMRRFVAWEAAPNYRLAKNWTVGLYYLQGNGLQKDGPRTTHFLTWNSRVSNINVGGPFRLTLVPAVYYLYLDGFEGRYFTATGVLSHTGLPFSLESSINKTFSSNLPGNKDVLWNVVLNYHFGKRLVTKK
jgi:hypothetical protein